MTVCQTVQECFELFLKVSNDSETSLTPLQGNNLDTYVQNLFGLMTKTFLFSEVLGNPHHVLHHLLPPVRHNIHNMRQRSHNRIIPLIKSNTFNKTFINHMVLKDCY